MRKLRKSMLFALLLAAVVSCGGGGGGGSSSNASTPVNMEINLKTDLSEAATLKVEAARLGVPVQPEFIKEGFESYYDKAGLVSYPLSSVENQMVNSGSALLRIDSVNHTQSLEEQVKNKFNSYNLSILFSLTIGTIMCFFLYLRQQKRTVLRFLIVHLFIN